MLLAAAAGAAAGHALITAAVADHDGAADVAAGSVSEVDHAGEGVGGVDVSRCSLLATRCSRTQT
jgi:hypothetical protein